MTKTEVIELIEKIEDNFVMTCISLTYIHNPNIRVLADTWMDPGSTVSFGRHIVGEPAVKYDVHKMYAEFSKDKANNIDFMKFPMMSMISFIHDIIRDNGFEKQDPEFEFYRHIRNAVSHGNKFTFKNTEPRKPASFKTLTIDASMNGMQNVINDYINFGDLLDLINFIKTNL